MKARIALMLTGTFLLGCSLSASELKVPTTASGEALAAKRPRERIEAVLKALSLQNGLARAAEALKKTAATARSVSEPRYQVAGTYEIGEGRFRYDDQTGALSHVSFRGWELEVAQRLDGLKRALTARVDQSPDGTTGSVELEAIAIWRPLPEPTEFLSPWSYLDPEASPDLGWWNITPASEATAPSAPARPEGALPFHVFDNEYPAFFHGARLQGELVPEGKRELTLRLAADFEDFQVMPGNPWWVHERLPRITRLPMSGHLDLEVPDAKLAGDWKARTHETGLEDFSASGTIAVASGSAPHRFTYALSGTLRDFRFTLTSLEAKVQLAVTYRDPDYEGHPATAIWKEVASGKQLGTLTLDPARPHVAVVQLEDGGSLEWPIGLADPW